MTDFGSQWKNEVLLSMIFMNTMKLPVLDRLRKNKNIEIFTIDRLCSILHCDIEDIVEHIPDPDEMNNNPKEISEKNSSSSENKKNSLWA